MRRNPALAIGIVATLASAWLWHGPGGAGDRLDRQLVQQARTMLDHYEMQQVTVSMESGPLSRRLLLGGPADAFQRSEIERMSETLPGVAEATWQGQRGKGGLVLPLLVEAMLLALTGFAIGVILAYVAALRRRARQAILQ